MIIGSIGLTYIHPIYKSAEFSITIGHKDYRGGGYGSDALRTIIKYGFEQLNLNRIWCEVYSNNDAIDIYRHIGFKDEGILRQTVFKNSEYLDSYVLGMLKSDYVEIKEKF
jgi:RimJ/RimL family protein N-acetyltransferase